MVFMTGGAFTAESQSFVDSVSNTVIHKPFSITELVAAVEKASTA